MKYITDIIPSIMVRLEREDKEIESLHMDSREVTPNGLFFCIEGTKVDGHDFASQAVNNGAAAVIAERHVDVEAPVWLVKDTQKVMAYAADHFYDHPTKDVRVIGITGTNGKTTTSHLVESILNEEQTKTGLIGTMYAKIGSESIETNNTTPESLELQQLFAGMRDKEVKSCVMEVSSHALQMGRVRGVQFRTAVFTNLSQDHLDYHGSMESYRNAKGLLFSQLGNSFAGELSTAVLNGDDAASAYFEAVTTVPVLTYGLSENNDIYAENINTTGSKTSFTLHTPWGSTEVEYPLLGKFNVYNALAAIAACIAENVSVTSIVDGLKHAPGVSGRFEAVEAGQESTIVVDYAHTPGGLENVVQTAREMTEGRLYAVIGCGGDRDKEKRPKMAAVAEKFSDMVILTSDNPRSEDPVSILEQMEAGFTGNTYEIIEDREKAIERAVFLAGAGDTVLIAGKGHETYQIVGDQTLPFDDRKVAKEAVRKNNKQA
ncbi:UDP-N-acetylmuramoyl-L-alanyl-D-glutamate--2,6-diaminopimelate ligase [Marinococcus halophilus]|uniref:UDP-N-acetylmuramoyl-L-alanyl-D-glutamate--2,6-diaminopimelate ligase n=1 Tax=Marinococcus halophilus TaxID=1371 RepID=A0A510Y291_MARHA|nr:UDP-N-acetylmuramoyl-L-alanyl-D-glutamate--2,6-diaminopimelate ligase [Marinococcus halophilus]OZT81362.1 UDP-N-acetylmuramoyl-L-alanyl-D-glutamate--2,6-diaminopimelate ligase [Marinococcus halophilus]GEK57313.1 UDP-N-acetylmuramoyl-L-alanyl-D-glutamate--2,6-diaminopimelate ligase [Marinococcus halophilus]